MLRLPNVEVACAQVGALSWSGGELSHRPFKGCGPPGVVAEYASPSSVGGRLLLLFKGPKAAEELRMWGPVGDPGF